MSGNAASSPLNSSPQNDEDKEPTEVPISLFHLFTMPRLIYTHGGLDRRLALQSLWKSIGVSHEER